MIMKILLLIQRSSSKARCRRTSVVCSKYIWGSDEGKYQLRKIVFKTGNLILNWLTLSFSYNHPMSERLSSQSVLPNCLVNWEQFGSTTEAYVKKSKFTSYFPELGKTEKSRQSNIQNSRISLRIGKNLEAQPKTNT